MSVGEELARARSQAGLSIDDVAAATKIRASLLAAMEGDDFGRCGGDVYARGHIRSIAHAVGADAEPLVETFDAEHGGAPEPTPPVPEPGSPIPDRDVHERPGRRRPHWLLAAAIVFVVVCVLAGVGVARGSFSAKSPGQSARSSPGPSVTKSSPDPTGSPRPSRSSASASTSPSTSPSPSPSPSASTKPASHGVTVALRVTGSQSWCRFTNEAGSVLYSGVLAHGQSKKFSAHKKLKVRIGDTRQVDLIVNGHDVGQPQGDGFVADLAFGPGAPSRVG
jgi:cytoskeletal protein RodZ